MMAAAICASTPTSLLAGIRKNEDENSMTDKILYAAVAMQLAARSVENTPDKAAARAQMLAIIGELESKFRHDIHPAICR